jgi:hypothetical protein
MGARRLLEAPDFLRSVRRHHTDLLATDSPRTLCWRRLALRAP